MPSQMDLSGAFYIRPDPPDSLTRRARHQGESGSSQIDDEIARRLRAADQEVALSWLVERLRPVSDRAGDQAALTMVADTGPTRPADRDLACLGQLQDALIG